MKQLYRSVIALAFVLASPAVFAATITVTTLDDELNSDGDCSLREAVAAANTNAAVDGCTAGAAGADAIVFDAGLAAGTASVTQGSLVVMESLSVDGETSETTSVTISGGDASRIFFLRAGALTLANLTLQEASAIRGAAVFVDTGASLDVDAVTFADNTATGAMASDGGAALYVNGGGTATVEDAAFSGNAASGAAGSGGAILNFGGTLTVSTSSFTGNTASRAGGAIEAAASSETTLDDTDFTDNETGEAPGNGGALHITGGGAATVTGGTVSGNEAASEGGGFWNGTGTMTLDDVTFTGNTAGGDAADNGGGAVFNNGGTLVATDVTATGNTATGEAGSGGAFMSVGGAMTLTGGTIDGNAANRAGAGIEVAGGNATLVSVTVNNNDIPEDAAEPGNGGGVHAAGDTLTVRGGEITRNDAEEGGGLWAAGVLIIEAADDDATLIGGNTARGDTSITGGGGIYVEGFATITDALLSGNAATGEAGSGGGLFAADTSVVSVTGGAVRNNRANRAGAGLENAGGAITLQDVLVTSNVIPAATAMPGNGGGLHSSGGTVALIGSTFSDNEATEGGGLWVSDSLMARSDTLAAGADDDAILLITSNTARGADATNGGGGLYVETGAVAMLTGALITDNAATGAAGSGGGLFVADSSSVSLAGGEVSDNVANRAGGGIEVADDPSTGDDGDDDTDEGDDTTLSLVQVTLADNRIGVAAPGNGGGLHLGGAANVTVDQSTVSGNLATEGAGLWAAGAGTLAVTRSTVTGNTAVADGGGIYDNGGATIGLESATVALNVAGGTGGGLLSQSAGDDASFSLANSVLAYNTAVTAGPDCSGTFVSGDHNLVETVTGCTLTGDTDNTITGQDPVLGALADNGGPTLTHLPDNASPLLDVGQSSDDADQRGLAREVGDGVDIGAVEREVAFVSNGNGPEKAGFALRAAYPNPVRGSATLAFTVEETGVARVDLYNVVGQRVQTLFDATVAAGAETTLRLDASRLAAGVYVVRLQSGSQQLTQRVTVVR